MSLPSTVLLVFFLAFLVQGGILVYSIAHRGTGGAPWLALIMVCSLLWLVGAFFELESPEFGEKVFWRNFTQIGVCFLPVSVLAFSFRFTEVPRRVFGWGIGLALGLAGLSLGLILTDGQHHLMRRGIELILVSGRASLKVHTTKFGALLMSYVSGSLLLSELFLLLAIPKVNRLARRQIVLIAAGIAFPLLFNIIKSFYNKGILLLIPTPIFFLPMGLCILAGVFRFGLLKASPLGISKVFDVIKDGILVTDSEGNVLEMNAEAESLLAGLPEDEGPGSTFERVAGLSSPWAEALRSGTATSLEFTHVHEGRRRIFSVKTDSLKPERNKPKAILSWIRDVTEETDDRQRLKIKAELDGLTGIFNRTTFEQYAQRMLEGSRSRDEGIAFIFFDLDDFKRINDTWGHAAGDEVLRSTAARVKACIKAADIFGRLGGEEFGLLLAESDREIVSRIAERIRLSIAEAPLLLEYEEIPFTASLGCTLSRGADEAFETLLCRADRALYEAKHAGKNRVRWA